MDEDLILFVITKKQNMLDLFMNFRVFRGKKIFGLRAQPALDCREKHP